MKTYALVKRALDISIAGVLLLVFSPLLLLASLAIKLETPGPVLYRGTRIGKNGVPFRLFKLRTMVAHAESIGGSSTANDDRRITKVGTMLRRYKLDELPNVINVLRGEMSLVGPRPQVAADVARYSSDERSLLTVRPGITDFASIRFRNEGEILRGEADPDEAYDRLIRLQKLQLGLDYVRSRSLAVDLRILWQTLECVLGLPTAPPPADLHEERA